MIADINGIKLAYSDTREGTPAILLVHGFPLNRAMWDLQLGTLRGLGLRVIAPDLRGFGASETGAPEALSMDQHADDLAALVDHLQIHEPVIVCGLSMGGYVAFALWRRHRARVRALVLADTRAGPDSPEARDARQALIDRVQEAGSVEPVALELLPRLVGPSVSRETALAQQLLAMMAGTQPDAMVGALRSLMDRPDSRPLLPSIDVPTLVVVGEHDAIAPPGEAAQMAAELPDARLEVIPLSGHMANMENPDAFNQALVAFAQRVAR